MRVFLSLFISFSLAYSANSQLVINEFLASNINGIVDEDNEYSDWIEIYNSGSDTIRLENYSFTDDISIVDKWTFPAVNMKPGQHLVVFASGKDRKELSLTYQTIIDWGDEWQYIIPLADPGSSWRYTEFDTSAWSIGPSGFGYGDDDDNTVIPTTNSIFIRKEFVIDDLASVERLLMNIDFDDGFIAYINGQEIARMNLGPGTVNFDQETGELLHTANLVKRGGTERYEVADPGSLLIEGTNVIAIEGHNAGLTSSDMTLIPFLTIGRSGWEYSPVTSEHISFPSGNMHTNFKIGVKGESLYLFDPLGEHVDSIQATEMYSDVSYGRQADGENSWYFFGEPTPGFINNTPGILTLVLDTVKFSNSGGNYSGGLNLTLSANEPGSQIYYTLDGSIPTTNDSLYQTDISISSSTVVRARVISSGNMPGPVITNTYITEIDHSFPIICLSTNPDNLWDELSGIYVLGPNPGSPNGAPPYPDANIWQDWEKPVHFELYDRQGIKQIDQGAGVKMFGGYTRLNDQKSMALFARSKYGKGSFKYKFFREKPFDKFESIVLRNSGNDNMGLQFQDGFITGLTGGMSIDKQAFEPAVVYINGEYWGILNMREKISEHFIASNHNIDKNTVNLLELNGQPVHGDNADYLEIIEYMKANVGLQYNSSYDWMKERIDIDEYIRYQLTQIYINNRDWPGNNIKFWNTTSEGSKFRWILYDTDFGFGIWNLSDYASNTLEFALEPYGPDWPNPPYSTLLFRRMVTNLNFRHNFINQYCDRLNTSFTAERISNHIDSLLTYIQPEIQNNFNKWSGNYGNWIQEIKDRKTFGQLRPPYARSHMRTTFGLGNELTVNIDVSDKKAGTVKLNSIVPSDYPFSGIYFTNVPVQLTAVPNPGYKFVTWEGSNATSSIHIEYNMAKAGSFKAIFATAGIEDISIVINEINYKSSIEKDTKDWIELYNNGSGSVSLEDWLISDTGPDSGYFIPSGFHLAPGEFIVLCRDLNQFKLHHPNVSNAVGDVPFGLSSNGDILRLYDHLGILMDAVDYQVYTPWPEEANGTGATLELKDPKLDNSRAENWKSLTLSGTPGRSNTGITGFDAEKNLAVRPVFESFPNPFTDYTTIQFGVTEAGENKLEVFDINGKLIDVLVQEFLEPGQYYIDWGMSSINGLSEGIYTLRLSTHNKVETIKLIKLK